MPCQDCLTDNCIEITPDSCVRYTGDTYDSLGICQGISSIKDVEKVLLTQLAGLMTGSGITLSGLQSSSALLSSLLAGNTSLVSVLQDYATAIDAVAIQVGVLASLPPTSFATGCLTLPLSPTRDQILQAAITHLCQDSTLLSAISADYVKASELPALIDQHLEGQPTAVPQYRDRMVPFACYEYYGSLSNFDAQGKGVAGRGFDKIYLCNGSNGTPDKRGRTAVGAVAGVPGGPLDAAVDPALNVGAAYGLKDRFGTASVTLTLTQIPSHSHAVIDPGHSHTYHKLTDAGHPAGSHDSNPRYDGTEQSGSSYTGITLGQSGGSQPHSNVQPSIAAYFIIYLP